MDTGATLHNNSQENRVAYCLISTEVSDAKQQEAACEGELDTLHALLRFPMQPSRNASLHSTVDEASPAAPLLSLWGNAACIEDWQTKTRCDALSQESLQLSLSKILQRKLPVTQEFEKLFPTIVQRPYTSSYVLNVAGISCADYLIRQYNNGLCVVSLAKSHGFYQSVGYVVSNENKPVSLSVNFSKHIVENEVKGKRKRNAIHTTPLMKLGVVTYMSRDVEDNNINASSTDSAEKNSSYNGSFLLQPCVKGKLIEYNKELLTTPTLLLSESWQSGWLFIIQQAGEQAMIKQYGKDITTYTPLRSEELKQHALLTANLQRLGASFINSSEDCSVERSADTNKLRVLGNNFLPLKAETSNPLL